MRSARWWSSNRRPRSPAPSRPACATCAMEARGTRSPASRPTIPNWLWRWRGRWWGAGPTTRKRRPRPMALVRLRPVRLRQHHEPGVCAAARAAGGKAEASRAAADHASQSNGSLMRVAPIGVWAGSPEAAAAAAMVNSTLSHPHPVCSIACGASPRQSPAASRAATGLQCNMPRGTLPPAPARRRSRRRDAGQGCRRNASGRFSAPDGLGADRAAATPSTTWPSRRIPSRPCRTVGAGGDTDTNAAIAGALLGAAAGRAAWPVRWTMPVLHLPPRRRIGGGASAARGVLARRPHRPRRGAVASRRRPGDRMTLLDYTPCRHTGGERSVPARRGAGFRAAGTLRSVVVACRRWASAARSRYRGRSWGPSPGP